MFTSLNQIGSFIQALEHAMAHNQQIVLDRRDYDGLVACVSSLASASHDLGWNVTESAAQSAIEGMGLCEKVGDCFGFRDASAGRVQGPLKVLVKCLEHESSLKVALVLAADKAELLNPKTPIFGSVVREQFPKAKFEVDEAAKCLAFGRATATIFHLMRVMEIALGAIHSCLGIPIALQGVDRNWGKILGRINYEVTKRSKGKAWAERDYFKEIYARLDAIKDAWRNQTMHVENVYTEQEAQILFDDTRALMEKIAARMDQRGVPNA